MVKRSTNFIISCCVLHNICIMNDYVNDLNIENIEYNKRYFNTEQDPNDRMGSEIKRNIICNLLAFN